MELISKSGNNKIYKDGDVIVKHYSSFSSTPCDRGKNDFNFIKYFWEKGCRNIPKPISYDEETNIGRYSFEEGKIIPVNNITSQDINATIDFLEFITINSQNDLDKFNYGKESCITTQDYINNMVQRINKLTNVHIRDKYDRKGKKILKKKLLPLFVREKDKFLNKNKNSKLKLSLNPGDFGFHNILKDGDKYIFFDFEYAGKDDIVKQGPYFVTHPYVMEMNEALKNEFTQLYKNRILTSKGERNRLDSIEGLVNLHWGIIQLNFLIPDFMHQSTDFKKGRLQTLNKYLDKVK